MDLLDAKKELKSKAPAFAQKVAPLYQKLCWEWQPKDKSFIPCEEDILNELLKLIDGLKPEYAAHGSGGLEVYYEDPSKEEGGHFGIRFIVEDDTAFE